MPSQKPKTTKQGRTVDYIAAFSCNYCRKQIRIEHLAGDPMPKRVNCALCGNMVTIHSDDWRSAAPEPTASPGAYQEW